MNKSTKGKESYIYIKNQDRKKIRAPSACKIFFSHFVDKNGETKEHILCEAGQIITFKF
jgi:hypothetical protein